MNYLYTNGVIAVREKRLLKDKIYRLAELSEADAFRMLFECGFGGGEETKDVETLLLKEEKSIDLFIREYAPSKADLAYLLAPRDFHNAKALLKSEYLKTEAEEMLSPAGEIPIETLKQAIATKDYDALNEPLQEALREAEALFQKEEGASGAEIGVLFERALYRYLLAVCKWKKHLKRILIGKIDRTNLLTAFRSKTQEQAEKMYLDGGKLTKETLQKVFLPEEEAEKAFIDSPYQEFTDLCFTAKKSGKPFTEAEKVLRSFESEYLKENTQCDKNLKFLSYVFTRRAEAENVRTVFVAKAAGMDETRIKLRLRA